MVRNVFLASSRQHEILPSAVQFLFILFQTATCGGSELKASGSTQGDGLWNFRQHISSCWQSNLWQCTSASILYVTWPERTGTIFESSSLCIYGLPWCQRTSLGMAFWVGPDVVSLADMNQMSPIFPCCYIGLCKSSIGSFLSQPAATKPMWS